MSVNDTITKQVNVQSGRVTTEGDELYYEVRGQGQSLLMIPAGGGDGDYYSAVAESGTGLMNSAWESRWHQGEKRADPPMHHALWM
jgi:hypothetical protein